MKILDLVLILMLGSVIMLLIVGIREIITEKDKCITFPFTYSIEKLSQHFNDDISCICNHGVSLNRTSIYITETRDYSMPGFSGFGG